MINKFSLTFKEPGMEKDFESTQHLQNLRELNSFIMLCIVSSIFKLITSISNQKYVLVGAIVAGLLLVTILRGLLQSRPQMLQHTLVIVQLGLLALYNFNQIIPAPVGLVFDNQWQLGFESALMHSYVYLQGTKFITQTITLALVFASYALSGNYETQDQINIQVEFLLLIFGVISLRFSFEKNKRKQYLEIIQNKKWQTVTGQILDQWIVLVKFDPIQEQLKIEKCSASFSSKLGVDPDPQFRRIIRDMKVYDKQLELEGVKNTKLMTPFYSTLENIIRGKLLQAQIQLPHENQFTNYNVYRVTTRKYYKVVLMDYFYNCEKMVFLSIHENKAKETIQKLNKQIKFHKSQASSQLSDLKSNISKLLMQLAQMYSQKQQKFGVKKALPKTLYSDCFWQLNQLYNISIWNNPQIKVKESLNRLTEHTFRQLICQAIQIKFYFYNHITIFTDFNYLQRIVLNQLYFIKQILQIEYSDIQLVIKQKDKEHVQFLSVKIVAQSDRNICGRLTTHLKKQISYTNQTMKHLNYNVKSVQIMQHHLQKCYKMMLDYNQHHAATAMNTAFCIVISKYLLTHFGCNNQIKYKCTEHTHMFKFKIINMMCVLPRSPLRASESILLSKLHPSQKSALLQQSSDDIVEQL